MTKRHSRRVPRSPDEQLILVDETNRAVGAAEKHAAHRAGLLHCAFSIFVVDECGRILLQQRSTGKYHSGGLWANSCCGHPRPGERTITAARRRLKEELGVISPLSFGFLSRYQADLDRGMSENEFVYLYFGMLQSPIEPDPAEVAKVDFLSVRDIGHRINSDPDSFAVWFKHYFRNHSAEIARLSSAATQ